MYTKQVYTMAIFSVLLVTLPCFICQTTDGSTTQPTEPPRGWDNINDEGLKAVYRMTNWYLEDLVQPRDLRYMEERGVNFADPDDILDSLENDWQDWTVYMIGYTICGAVGVLLFIFMPIIALFICCCRCCGNCGGKTIPRDKKNSPCQRTCCSIFLFLFSSAVLLGGIAMIFASIRFVDMMGKAPAEETVYGRIASGLDEIDAYMVQSVNELNQTALGSFQTTKVQIFSTLDKAVPEAVETLDNQTLATQTLNSLIDFDAKLQTTSEQLQIANDLSSSLQTQKDQFDPELNTTREDLRSELLTCMESACNDARAVLDKLYVQVDFASFNFGNEKAAVDGLIGLSLGDQCEKGLQALNDITNEVNNDVQKYIDDAKTTTDEVEAELVTFMQDISTTVNDLGISTVSESVMRFVTDDVPAWVWDVLLYVMVSLGGILCLLVLCFYMGLLHGLVCPRPSPTNTDYCCTRKMGADWLMAGIGMTFIFYWLYALITMVTFLSGGIIHTEACRHVTHLDTSPVSSIMTELVNNTFVENTGVSVNISAIYSNCRENQAIYTALDLASDPKYNITKILDTSAIDQVIEDIKNINIDPFNVDLLPENTLDELTKVNDIFQAYVASLTSLMEVLNLSVVATDLNSLAAKLDEITDSGVDVEAYADALRNYSTHYVEPMQQDMQQLNQSLLVVNMVLSSVNTETLANQTQDAEDTVNTEGNSIIKTYIDTTADSVGSDVKSLTSSIETQVENDIGQCFPVYSGYVTMVDAACVETLYPLNALWFSLGWCLFFLIPCLCLAFKLVSLFRKSLKYSTPNKSTYRGYNDLDDGGFNAELTYTRPPPQVKPMPAVDNPIYQYQDLYPEDHYRIPRPNVRDTVVRSNKVAPSAPVRQQNNPHNKRPGRVSHK